MATEIRRVEAPAGEPSSIEKFFGWISENIVLIAIMLIVVLVVIVAVWFFLKYYKKKKLEKDLSMRDFETVLKNCRLQADRTRIRKRSGLVYIAFMVVFALIELNMLVNNTPLIITWYNALLYAPVMFVMAWFVNMLGFFTTSDPVFTYSGKQGESPKYQGNYTGDFVSEDGYHNIAFWSGRRLILWKKYYVVKCNMNQSHHYYEKIMNKKTNKYEMIEKTLKMEDGLVLTYRGNITIKGLSLDKLPDGYFLYPVLYDRTTGNVVDNRFIHAERVKNTYLNQMIIDQASDFSQAMREAILVNPTVRGVQKMRSETIERPLSEEERRNQFGY
jgi:hypothetical protein